MSSDSGDSMSKRADPSRSKKALVPSSHSAASPCILLHAVHFCFGVCASTIIVRKICLGKYRPRTLLSLFLYEHLIIAPKASVTFFGSLGIVKGIQTLTFFYASYGASIYRDLFFLWWHLHIQLWTLHPLTVLMLVSIFYA